MTSNSTLVCSHLSLPTELLRQIVDLAAPVSPLVFLEHTSRSTPSPAYNLALSSRVLNILATPYLFPHLVIRDQLACTAFERTLALAQLQQATGSSVTGVDWLSQTRSLTLGQYGTLAHVMASGLLRMLFSASAKFRLSMLS